MEELANTVFNEDEEMLQIAMALSMNETSQEPRQPQQQPPPTMPRTRSFKIADSTDTNNKTTLSTDSTQDLSKSSRPKKKIASVEDSTKSHE